MRRRSFAKINLHLSVLGKRPDGYHDILTLMQRISLADEMEFLPATGGITLRCPGHPELENAENLVFRAAYMIIAATHWPGGVKIILKKHIPIAAGLGGGSSNAATTLLVMNEMMGGPLRREELAQMGKKLGADVPFFIYEKNAWASGIGDILTEAGELPFFHVLLVNPGFHLSTRLVYENLNLRLTKNSGRYNIRRISDVGDIVDNLRNDLEAVALGLHPVIGAIKEKILSFGAEGALMSGSGPTVFGLFLNEEKAKRVAEELKGQTNWNVLVAHTI
ncbi:MAG TPA: 4-(cytidine 5'-diphospho)-2-C-methyl-D-erythritol kinase [Syntrophales bacterium]|nr:4-(cytidine 5'-diphospho)-2-C-methyl-D-erythritol kinase [Syntrophales bacterium]HOL59270.1 4-(cytidine 5'-diphospho)-2-C-methyl-D-erythritol kinase [Syntrophales bacterium]HPO35320.1 4-(cytidine 5'-diphospho)-2-C-methyl-D-erythritol kinase [Syntrophales bacterium]